jgi:hypothetical protein
LTPVDPDKRILDMFAAGLTPRPEPQLSWGVAPAPAPLSEAPPAPQAAAAAPPPFETDAPVAPAQLALPPQTMALLGRTADLLRRADAPSPFAVGLLSPPGGGKSSALRWLVENLSGAGATVVTLRAADLAAEPERSLAAALFRALSPVYAALADEAAQEGAHRGADAGALARLTHERLDALRRRLMSEQQTLAQTEARCAALTETQLYETPGSRVDSYARRMRAAFEPRLRRFGFTGDPLSNFKHLTRDLQETGGLAARVAQSLRALYAFRGQVRLLVLAAIAFCLDKGADWLFVNKASWLDTLGASSSLGAQARDFLQAHIDWLPRASSLLGLLGFVLLAWNIWRAFSFMQPLVHAAGLLDEDVAAKRREVEQLLAHQARNVDLVGAEAAALGRQAAEAERRAVAAGASRHPPPFLETDPATQKREFSLGFLECLSELIVGGKPDQAPGRLIVALDGFESVANPVPLFNRLHDLLARSGFVAVHALDPEIFGSARANFLRRIQLPLRLDARNSGAPVAFAPLDAPLSAQETQLLDACAPLAGAAPRVEKRLRNLYRFLRPAPAAPSGLKAALALLLAADLGATPDEIQGLGESLEGGGAGFAPKGSPRLQEAFARASALDGAIDGSAARQAADLARCVTTG